MPLLGQAPSVTFANPLPWWALVLVIAGAGLVAWQGYRQLAAPPSRRAALTLLRFVTLVALVIFLMRPIARTENRDARDAVVPILVDTSRSMAVQDAGDLRRIDRARTIVSDRLLSSLGSRFHTEVLAFGDGLSPATADQLAATARRSDLQGALTALRARYRGRVVAGVVLVSDGGDTSGGAERAAAETALPVFPVGVGSRTVGGDREVLSVTAAESVADGSRIELAVSAVSHGLTAGPMELRLLENGRSLEVRRTAPAGDGTPVREVFRVSPPRGTPTVYTVEIPPAAGELVPENNSRSVLVQAPARPRRVLLVEGAPGFEHSFLKRAWSLDDGVEVDSSVRKGKNEQGSDTFYIQAARSRTDALKAGYPDRREALFTYDAIALANVDGDMLTRSQLEMTRAFVARRGGGLLVLGARSFLRQGLMDTALEEVLPLLLSDRGGAVLPASAARAINRVSLTPDGAAHPVMQIAADPEDTRKRWEAAPPLSAIAPLGGPRPGATVLAMTSGAGGAPRALIAVQRFGEGRTMIFSGEAAWRWRMMLPSSDKSYDTFWRQAIRWLAMRAGDPVSITVPAGAAPGDPLRLDIAVRDAAFEPQTDSGVDVRITRPDGRLDQLHAALDRDAAADGRFAATYKPDQPGVYRVSVEARRGSTVLGTVSASMLVGGADLEMTDPRLNDRLLQRVALASGGRVLAENDLASLPAALTSRLPAASLAVSHDLWHNAWSFVVILVLLATEWIVRRRWGLR
jgi:uncharacterized membrane protein